MASNLKLGSNWKACGYLYDMRRWSHGNTRIGFGFCKGDDNYGGVKRKELDDFLKSLGKTYNLVLYRMQDTENLRSRLRERRRNEERSKAAMEEEREKAGEGRLERNKRWRLRKEAPASSASSSCSFKELEEIQEEEKLSRRREPSERRQDEKEARREKNREWRMKRRQGEDDSGEKTAESKGPRLGELLQEVLACSCSKGLGTTTCTAGHFMCEGCSKEVCPQCEGEVRREQHASLHLIATLINNTSYVHQPKHSKTPSLASSLASLPSNGPSLSSGSHSRTKTSNLT